MEDHTVETRISTGTRVRAGVLAVALAATVAAGLLPGRPPSPTVDDRTEGPDDAWFWARRTLEPGMTPGVLTRALASFRRSPDPRTGARIKLTAPPAPWVALGPQPISPGTASEFSGRVLSIAPHPSDANVILIGAALGGVWKTTDAGAHWRPVLADRVYPAIISIDFDPRDARLVYALSSGRGTESARLFQSQDTGETWRELPLPIAAVTPPLPGQVLVAGGTKVLVDPQTAGTAETTSVYVLGSYDTGQLLRVDGAGRTATVLYSGSQMRDLVVDKSQPSRLFLLKRDAQTGCPSACLVLFRSEDAGAHWSAHAVTGGTGSDYAKLAQSRSSPNVLLSAFLDRSASRVRTFLSTDFGDHWTEKGSPEASQAGQWPLTVAIHPTDPNTLLVGNINLYQSTNAGSLWLSTQLPHVDQTVSVYDAAGNLLAGNDGGIFRRPPSGTWSSLNRTLPITQAYSIAAHPSAALTFVSGTQDTGTVQFNGPVGWRALTGSDGGAVGFDVGASGSATYAETQWSRGAYSFYRCTGACQARGTGLDRSLNAAFTPAFAVDPRHTSTVWLPTSVMYRSDDGGLTFTAASPTILGFSRCAGCSSDAYFTSVAVAPSDSNVVYAGGTLGGLWTTSDRGGAWRTTDSGLPFAWVESIAVDPTEPSTAYCTLGGFGTAGHVFKTSDRGASWTSISGNLPAMPVNAVLVDPDSVPRMLYIGTDIGVFRAQDAGGSTTWEYYSDGMPPAIVTGLSYAPATRTIAAATLGRGIFVVSPGIRR